MHKVAAVGAHSPSTLSPSPLRLLYLRFGTTQMSLIVCEDGFSTFVLSLPSFTSRLTLALLVGAKCLLGSKRQRGEAAQRTPRSNTSRGRIQKLCPSAAEAAQGGDCQMSHKQKNITGRRRQPPKTRRTTQSRGGLASSQNKNLLVDPRSIGAMKTAITIRLSWTTLDLEQTGQCARSTF